MMRDEGIDYRNTTLFMAGFYSFGLVGFPLLWLMLKPVAYLFGNDFPGGCGTLLLPILIWPSWLLVLLCRKIRVPLHVKTRLSTRGLAIMAVLLFLHLGAMDQIRKLLMTSAEDVTDYKTGLCIWYGCSLVLEIYFVIQLICSAPAQRWIQRKYVRIICLVFIGLAFFFLVVWYLIYPPYKTMSLIQREIMASETPKMLTAFVVTMILIQPWYVYLISVVVRSMRNLIRRDRSWKDVFLFPDNTTSKTEKPSRT